MRSSELREGAVYKVGGYQEQGLQVFTGEFREVTRGGSWRSNPRVIKVPLFRKMHERDGDPAYYEVLGIDAPKLGDVEEQARKISPGQIEGMYAIDVERAIENLQAEAKVRQQRAEEKEYLAGLLEGLTGRTWGTTYPGGQVRFTLSLGAHEVVGWVTEMHREALNRRPEPETFAEGLTPEQLAPGQEPFVYEPVVETIMSDWADDVVVHVSPSRPLDGD